MARTRFMFLLAFVACGSPEAPPPRPPVSRPAPPPAAAPRCPPDAQDLLGRHAREFGAVPAVAAALPLTFAGNAQLDGKPGRATLSIDRDAWREEVELGSIYDASGVDAAGAWVVGSATGILEALRPDEAFAPNVQTWILRRSYTTAFDPSRDAMRCDGLHVELLYRIPEIGSPTLSFDQETAALLSITHELPEGRVTTIVFDSWSDRDASGIRWPKKTSSRSGSGNAYEQTYDPPTHGLSCANAPCLARPPSRTVFRFPEKGVVRVPFVYLGSAVLLRVKVGGREAWAILDSGAGISVVEATSRAAEGFVPSIEVAGAGSTQKIRLGVGELASLDVGDLHAEHLPVASVPIPAFESFGNRRPEVLLGYSFFAGAAVRVDYTRSEIVFAKTADGLYAKAARDMPMRVLGGKLVADGIVEGHPATFQLDTGNSGGLDLYAKWARARALPGSRPVAQLTGHFGAGAAATTSTFFRLTKGSLGPIAFDDHLVHVADPPDAGVIAGIAGNDVFARCDAITFDHDRRRAWLDGPCDKAVPEPRAGWRVGRSGGSWYVAILWPGGAAERAGMLAGDRIVELDGKPLGEDVAPLVGVNARPEGTKVPVVLDRNGKKIRTVLELHAPLR